MNFFVFMALLTLSLAESCLDLNGQEVSWWVAIKIPTSVAVKSSTYFLYSDANVAKHSSSFQEFNFTIDRHNSPLTLTLDQINKNHDLNVLAWNDEKPGPRGATSSGAHAKAVFVANSAMKKGFYVGHSMPRYPDFKGKSVNTSIPDSANIYGQSLICMTLDTRGIEDIANNLYITDLNIYQNTVTDRQNFPSLYKLAQPKQLRKEMTKIAQVSFPLYQANEEIVMISKNAKAKDVFIFENGILPAFKCDLISETWGRPLQPTICNTDGHSSMNIKNIQVKQGIAWSETQDHSKWAACQSEQTPVVCIGDMNRMISQAKRGGSFFCIRNSRLWSAYHSIANKIEECVVNQ